MRFYGNQCFPAGISIAEVAIKGATTMLAAIDEILDDS
jgi:hypothetical protein